MNDTPERRAAALLKKMTVEEKLRQVTADMYFNVEGADYAARRDPLCGSYRNPGHFMHYERQSPASPAEVTEKINEDVRGSIEAQPNGIPPIENGEALHGAQWGMGTCFPQPIAMASAFNPALTLEAARVIGAECAAVGVRQVFAPVVNLVRDCRWGRTVESFGEDVKICCDMGAAMTRGLQENGVIATPKHFADNYAAGGRDSNYSETSERTLRETFLPPFKACFDAGAKSVMAAYNGWDGVPCTANRRLLTDILRREWGFDGFTVSDYGGVEGLNTAHGFAASGAEAAAMALKAGLDVILPYNSYETVKEAFDRGLLTEADLDENVLRILTAKFRLGLFDNPYKDPAAAQALVRNDAHRALALKAARETIILLKNNGVLPLDKTKIKTVGVFGQSAGLIPVGSNYSGPYGTPWTGADAPTPLEALRAYLGADVTFITAQGEEIAAAAKNCDVNLYFTSLVEGEGADRSDLRLPSVTVHKTDAAAGGLIVDAQTQTVTEDQEAAILALAATDPNAVVILLNGAPVDMTAWIDPVGAVLEAWYPGEQGAKALTEILFGETNPSAKTPITFPRHAGQAPLFYDRKPSGRGYGYCDNDGSPLFPFGFGLSYTSFVFSDAQITVTDDAAEISFTVKNTGKYDGAEIAQLYVSSTHCETLRPLKQLKAYTRVEVKAGQTRRVSLKVTRADLSYYNADMVFGPHNGDHRLILGASSADEQAAFDLRVRDGKICI